MTQEGMSLLPESLWNYIEKKKSFALNAEVH